MKLWGSKKKEDKLPPSRKILVVCTGNTCRSPMAEAYLKSQLSQKGLDEFVEVSSCGTGTRDGFPPSMEAVFLMKNREMDISDYRSTVCQPEHIQEAHLIIAMSQKHTDQMLEMVPEAKDKIITLEVPDPIGMSLKVYQEAMELIEKGMAENWDRIQQTIEGI